MPTIPQYKREVQAQLTAEPYRDDRINGDMFGLGIGEAQANLRHAQDNVKHTLLEIQARMDDTKILGLVNHSSQWEQQNLYNRENGYYFKQGKDAYGQSESLLKNYDQYINDYIQKSKLSPSAQKRAKDTASRLRERVAQGITVHDFKSGVEYSNTEAELAKTNYITTAVNMRNSEAEISRALVSGYQAIEMQGEIQHLDETSVKAAKMQYRSQLHEAVLNAYLGEGSLKAGQYLEAHKKEINPQKLPEYMRAVKNEETKYSARNIADNLFATSTSEEEALKKAEAIKDIDLSDSVAQRLRQKYSQVRRLQEQEQANLIDDYLNKAAEKIKQGQAVTEDDIPQGLDGKHYLDAKSQLEHLNSFGDISTDSETYTRLWYTSNYDAQRFKDMDLSIYRLSLARKDYDDLVKRQEAIKKGDYITTLTNSESTKKYIEQVTGIKESGEKRVFEQYQNMLREHELRAGRKATDIEKEQFLKYLGSDKNNYKKIEKAMKDNADFHRELSNKINYYQAKHNGDMPDEQTVNRWIKEQSIEYKNGKYQTLKDSVIQNTKRVPNEQITLTNFADNYIPQLGQKIGAELKVTSRYRPANGKYTSKHSEGRALDIGYTTKSGKKLTLNQKVEMIEEVLKRPDVEKIAISSKDTDGKAILEQLRKDLGRKDKELWNKIQDMNQVYKDGKTRDEYLGTNHLHVTLYRDNSFGGNDVVTMRNQLKQRGWGDDEIQSLLKSRGLI